MNKSKRELKNKTIKLHDNGNEFEVYVTYGLYKERDNIDELLNDVNYFIENEIFIEHFESNSDLDIPEWVTETLIIEHLVEELLIEDFDNIDFIEDENETEFDEYW